MSAQMYTEDQFKIELLVKIALLEQKNDVFSQFLTEIKSEIKSQFHWTMGLISGLYAIVITGVIAKAFGAL